MSVEELDKIDINIGKDLKSVLDSKTKIKICASYFSIYGYSKLAKELSKVEEFNFLFNSPTFFEDESEKRQQKEFFIPPYVREKSIAGGRFELKLRNGLMQKSIAKECREWIKKKCKFKTLVKNIKTNNGLFLDKKEEFLAYANFDSFTADGLGF